MSMNYHPASGYVMELSRTVLKDTGVWDYLDSAARKTMVLNEPRYWEDIGFQESLAVALEKMGGLRFDEVCVFDTENMLGDFETDKPYIIWDDDVEPQELTCLKKINVHHERWAIWR